MLPKKSENESLNFGIVLASSILCTFLLLVILGLTNWPAFIGIVLISLIHGTLLIKLTGRRNVRRYIENVIEASASHELNDEYTSYTGSVSFANRNHGAEYTYWYFIRLSLCCLFLLMIGLTVRTIIAPTKWIYPMTKSKSHILLKNMAWLLFSLCFPLSMWHISKLYFTPTIDFIQIVLSIFFALVLFKATCTRFPKDVKK